MTTRTNNWILRPYLDLAHWIEEESTIMVTDTFCVLTSVIDVVGSIIVKCACRLQIANSSACVTSLLNHTHTEETMKFVIITVHFLLLCCWDSLNFPDCVNLTYIFYPKLLVKEPILRGSWITVEKVAKCVLLMLLGLLYFLSIMTKRAVCKMNFRFHKYIGCTTLLPPPQVNITHKCKKFDII